MNTIELYQQSNSPELAQQLLDEHKQTIDKHITKWSGVLPDVVIKKHAHRYALDAFKSFDTSKGADIKTHLFNHLSKLSRLNYENQNVVKIPEHQILQIRNYQDSVTHLKDVLDRNPSHEELADHMVMPVAHIKRLATHVNRKDYTYDSDYEDMQQGDIQTNPESLYIADTFNKLDKREQQQFQDLTGYNDVPSLKPGQFGKKHKLKPYEVSRVKTSLAKRFK
jgi:DNA-directed RNA polymerase specialized sigma subunit